MTNRTLIIGAHGQIGQRLVRLLAEKKLPVRAMVRKEEQLETFAGLDVETHVADLEEDFSAALAGCDNIIFTAGSGGATGADKTLLVDLWGALKTIDLAKAAGIRHFIMISSFNSHNPDTGPVTIKPYLVAKYAADQYLRNSELPFTILRPARLTDEPGSGQIRTDRNVSPEQRHIARADVAQAVLVALTDLKPAGQIIDLCQGDQDIAEALTAI